MFDNSSPAFHPAGETDTPFGNFASRVINGGTVTDADVNEWVTPLPWWRRAIDWLLEVLSDGD